MPAAAIMLGAIIIAGSFVLAPRMGSASQATSVTAETEATEAPQATATTYQAQSVSVVQTSSTTSNCETANPLTPTGFDVNVQFAGRWNATAIVYADSILSPSYVMCYLGDGPGSISVSGWDQHGGRLLDVTVTKADGSNGNLTVTTADGQSGSTMSPYGKVMVNETAYFPYSG